MSSTPPTRRSLTFQSFDEVLREIDLLHSRGYDRAGQWDLAQVCGHLDPWLRYPIDGYPSPPLPIRALLWILSKTVVPGQLRALLATGQMPAGGPTMKETVPPPGSDERAAVEKLQSSIARWRAHQGPLHSSPLFGSLSRPDWDRLQLIHCAHHLGFLIPR